MSRIYYAYKKSLSFFLILLSVLGYGVVVFGAQLADGTPPPSGGYVAGDSILDPGCAPGSTNCYQNTGSGWGLTGNTATTAGTNFIGTTDAEDFVIKTNNTQSDYLVKMEALPSVVHMHHMLLPLH